mmetsp:Transcript_12398/g.28704  ORF Transcript_12398/g.28704 Transcript_12398/m.28704 type:complete len:137 (+) Transcript_12398:473-883(+)
MKQLEDKFGYSKVFFFLGIYTILGLFVFLVGGSKLISDLFGFVYPAYMSFKSVDSEDTKMSTQWLTYWVVFSTFAITEQVALFLVEFIPFYYVIKVGFFLWLYHPKFLGAKIIYDEVIKPAMLPYLEMAQKEKKAA